MFQKYIPDINLHNAADKLADLFASIIREAAAATRKSPGKSAQTDSDAESIEAEVVDDEMPSGAAGEDKKNNRYSAADKCYPKWGSQCQSDE